MDKPSKCAFCDRDIYIQVEQVLMPATAPMTYEGMLRDELINITGKTYVLLPKRYCPMCGAKMDGGDKDELDYSQITTG